MSLDQFKQPDGWYKLDGADFENAVDAIQTGFLGFCGCGTPEENIEYIRKGLELLGEPYPKDGTYAEQKPEWDARQARRDEHFGNHGSAYFFYYWADKNGLTEHGGAVPGWLTEKGKHLLALLNECPKEPEDEPV